MTGGTRTCESRERRTGLPCCAQATWHVQVGTRKADAQLACGRHLNSACEAMLGAEERPGATLTLTAVTS